MAFLKNPFRKSAPAKSQTKAVNPATTINNQSRGSAQGVKAGTAKSSLPKNYLDPNSVF
ncbi:MAG: hypothetical protein L0Z73_07570 [Gammaproteobacteria bacterium]|nr:hypothetical protein [Gammaproteobacteria bacterium]